MPTLKIIYKWINENRLIWAMSIIGFAIGIRIVFLVFTDPHHLYTLHDILWGYR